MQVSVTDLANQLKALEANVVKAKAELLRRRQQRTRTLGAEAARQENLQIAQAGSNVRPAPTPLPEPLALRPFYLSRPRFVLPTLSFSVSATAALRWR